MGPRLPPLVAAEAHSDPPHRRLSGIEPQQPDAPKTTASATDPTLPPRCRSRPATLPPPQDAYQLQLCGARRSISPGFPISPALLHQHHAQPRPRIRVLALSDSGHLHGWPWPDGVYKVLVGVRTIVVHPPRCRRRARVLTMHGGSLHGRGDLTVIITID